MTDSTLRVVVVGAGAVGRGWATCFAAHGHSVTIVDASPGVAEAAAAAVLQELKDIRGLPSSGSPLVSSCDCLADAVREADHVQENIVEDLRAKRALFEQVGAAAGDAATIASSTSALLPDAIFRDLPGRDRMLVAHPFNPVDIMRLVEIVPSPWTSEATVRRCHDIMLDIGKTAITVRKALPGFVANRLQAAVINEAMHLVAQGVVSPADLDLSMRYGLGPRWSFMGPFETMDLNSLSGFRDYACKLADTYQDIGRSLAVAAPWDADAIERIAQWRRQVLPVDLLDQRRAWRDQMLKRLDRIVEAQSVGEETKS